MFMHNLSNPQLEKAKERYDTLIEKLRYLNTHPSEDNLSLDQAALLVGLALDAATDYIAALEPYAPIVREGK